jgi:MFS-type transporter involved in bile tolerance (Atg22 family)
MAIYSSIIVLPWSFKILWGLITDNVPICGLKRKPYLIFFGWVQFLAMLLLFTIEPEDPIAAVMLLFTASLSMAFSNVVVDAILVVQARKDSELGSQDLLSIAWFVQSLGGITGAVIAAFVMEDIHPKWAFLMYGIWGGILGIVCIFLSAEAEIELNEGEEDGLSSRFSSAYVEG